MDTVQATVRRLGGLVPAKLLLGAGVSPRDLQQAVATQTLLRVRRGFYAVPETPAAALTAVRVGGRLSGLSATDSYGLWGGWSEPVHVSVLPNASRLRTVSVPSGRHPGTCLVDDRWHRPVLLHWDDDHRDADQCWRVGLPRAVAQVMRWHDTETAVACLDTVRSLRGAGEVALKRLADGIPRLEALVRASRPGMGSGVESITRQRLTAQGVELEAQADIPFVGTVDFRVVGTAVLIEVDGFEFHRSKAQFDEDRRRDAVAVSRGWIPLRFSADQVRDRWQWVQGTVLTTVARGRL